MTIANLDRTHCCVGLSKQSIADNTEAKARQKHDNVSSKRLSPQSCKLLLMLSLLPGGMISCVRPMLKMLKIEKKKFVEVRVIGTNVAPVPDAPMLVTQGNF
jgi:hypothetical protein